MPKKPNPEWIDADNPEWTPALFAKAQPAKSLLPTVFGPNVAKELLKPRGRPRSENPKERINIRLSAEVLAHFKSAGDGWQTRIDAALRQYIADQPRP
jgi:uncharacterized protein (DUF4415 family)